jgi:hypothetical protein
VVPHNDELPEKKLEIRKGAVKSLTFPISLFSAKPKEFLLNGLKKLEALGQVFFSKYYGFPCQSSFHQFLHNHPHLSSVAGTIGQ